MSSQDYGDRPVTWTEHPPRRAGFTVTACIAVLVISLGACGRTRDTVSSDLVTSTEGVLTVAADLPAAGFWEIDADGRASGGFEWALADALADRFDLRLEVVHVPFEQLAVGELGGADLALAQIEVTADRDDVMDFSVPYLDSDMGVLVRTGDTLRDLAGAREVVWVAVASSTEEQFVRDTISPDATLQLADDETDAAAAVASGRADAALIDLVSALLISADQGALDTTARFATGGRYAVALPDGSPNRELVDASIRAFDADGTLESLAQRWLVPALDRLPDDVPVILSR